MKLHRMIRFTLIGVTALAGAISATAAANGDIPIYQPTTITEPGRYIVTRDISASGDILIVSAAGVSVDLNGHTIKSMTGSPVVIDLTGAVGPTCAIGLQNGRIAGGAHGIHYVVAQETVPIEIDSVEIVGPMFHCVHLPVPIPLVGITGSTLRGCGGSGIHATGDGTGMVQVVDSFITDVQGDGIFLSGVAGAVVRDTTVGRYGLNGTETGAVHAVALGKLGLSVMQSVMGDSSALSPGILVEQPSPGALPAIQIHGNRISAAGASGIDLRNAVAAITGNTIVSSGGDGIRIDAAGRVGPNMIVNNEILDNALEGVHVVAGVAELRGNTIGGNQQNGVRVAGVRALVDGNFLQGNGGAGLLLLNGTGHAYRNNFVRGNTGAGIDDQFNNTDAGGNIK